jgi:hypothetical protein
VRSDKIPETFSITVLARHPTNSIRQLTLHTNRINPFLRELTGDSVVTADPEFDVTENYTEASEHGIKLVIKQKEENPGWKKCATRRRMLECFDKSLYRRRKLGERAFGSFRLRKTVLHYREAGMRLKGSLLVACAHNLQAYFACKARSELFVVSELQ